MVGVSTPVSAQGETRCCLVWPKVLEVLNKGENTKLDIPAPFSSRQHKALHPAGGTTSVGTPDATCQDLSSHSTC